ncbi:hypothetical protein K1719_028027 [Acacia pycnantha]|nr:hypothetical protein K1719_028027 [Acacia pycnantha]
MEENNGRQFIKRRDMGLRIPVSIVKENGPRMEAVIVPKGSQQRSVQGERSKQEERMGIDKGNLTVPVSEYRGKGNGQVMWHDTGVSDCRKKKQGLDSVENVGQYYGDDMEDNGGRNLDGVVGEDAVFAVAVDRDFAAAIEIEIAELVAETASSRFPPPSIRALHAFIGHRSKVKLSARSTIQRSNISSRGKKLKYV